jgi:hypothetical protein
MREAYVTTRDALGVVNSALYAKKGTRPRAPKLWYFDDDQAPKGVTGAELELAVNRLAIVFPDRVH